MPILRKLNSFNKLLIKNISYRLICLFKGSYKKNEFQISDDKNDIDCLIELGDYFINENIKKSNKFGTRVYYKGAPSNKGYEIDSIESSIRILPLMATCTKYNYCNYSLEITKRLTRGTDHKSNTYWGDIQITDQRVCEMHDVALTLYLTKDSVFDELSNEEKSNLKRWLVQGASSVVVENNWLLFKFVIQIVLFDLFDEDLVQEDLINEVLSWEIKGGFFKDGPQGSIDMYTSWAIHYSLYFIIEIISNNQTLNSKYLHIVQSLEKLFCLNHTLMLKFHTSLPKLYGRSKCYRYASNASLLISSILIKKDSKRVLRNTTNIWRYYNKTDKFTNGTPSQFVPEEDRYSSEPYIGPGSSLWSLRSIILSLILFRNSNNEQSEEYNESLIISSKSNYFYYDGQKDKLKVMERSGSQKVEVYKNLIHEFILGRNCLKANRKVRWYKND